MKVSLCSPPLRLDERRAVVDLLQRAARALRRYGAVDALVVDLEDAAIELDEQARPSWLRRGWRALRRAVRP
ncbi:MAG: hypothetical protein JNK49_21520 [Planctomycetes bacterium]|nr:hypothetical protein [Planctomycetota bacterium]